MTILAGKTPIEVGREFIAQDVVAHFDGFRFHGINLWASWISYIRTRGRVTNLDLQVERIVTNDDGTVTAFGRWHALQNGQAVVSNLATATYRFENGKIVEIWTNRHNYILLFGTYLRYRWGLVLMILHMWLWMYRTEQPNLLHGEVPSVA